MPFWPLELLSQGNCKDSGLIISAYIGLIYGLSFLFYNPNPHYTLSDRLFDGLSNGVGIGLGSFFLQYLLLLRVKSATRHWERLIQFGLAVLGPRALLVAVVIGLIFGPILGLICGLSYVLISLTVSPRVQDTDLTPYMRSLWKSSLSSRYINRTVWIRYTRRTLWRRWQQISRFFQSVQGSHVLLVAVIIASSFGLSTGLRDILSGGSAGLTYELGYALHTGLHAAVIYGLSYALIRLTLSIQMTDIHLTERIRWTWNSLVGGLFNTSHLRITIWLTSISSVFIGLSYALSGSYSWQINALSFGLINGLSFGVSYWLLFGLFQGIAQERIEDQDRQRANQGIHHSLRNSVIMGIVGGTIIGSVAALIYPLNVGLSNGLNYALSGFPSYGLSFWLNFGLSNALSAGLVAGISGALLTCILTGGLAVWRHYVIRLQLWRSHTFPMLAPQFLDDATARSLLRRVGGGYSFTHRLLLDHLVGRETTPKAVPS